ncbi:MULTISPECIES: hypothetical protein [Prauserella salsuginis group]|uniref:Uncharacterized protein n=1 Tax=Prauserella salsuginis TaxID=387889 RepID=A0ABW6FWT5_9PSEU|nr:MULTISPECIES: hypothetical protein [Prauserella salsuginis group]
MSALHRFEQQIRDRFISPKPACGVQRRPPDRSHRNIVDVRTSRHASGPLDQYETRTFDTMRVRDQDVDLLGIACRCAELVQAQTLPSTCVNTRDQRARTAVQQRGCQLLVEGRWGVLEQNDARQETLPRPTGKAAAINRALVDGQFLQRCRARHAQSAVQP